MKKIAILIAQEFEDMEVMYPKYRFKEAGMEARLISSQNQPLKGKKGYPVTPDQTLDEAQPSAFEGVLVPGGWAPDYMRRDQKYIDFLKDFSDGKRMVAAICHGGWMLSSAGLVKNKTLTSFFAIKDDLKNAGAEWKDAEVVVDQNLITARKPDDLPAFMHEILKFLS